MNRKKMLDAAAKDLWVVLLDLVAVNLSYYLALLIRFFVNFQLRPVAVDRYLPAWLGFTPFYSVAAILVFLLFRLYGGIWRYAGINDMNRIILANLTTSALHVLGTILFFTRMPITYYIIGTLLQFIFTVAIRFGYRVLLVEKKKISRRNQGRINALIVGSGENGRRVVKHLEEGDVYRPVAVIGAGSGMMDGVPIISEEKADWKDVGAVFIADPLLSSAQREEIRKKADAVKAEVSDYTGFYTNLGGRLSLTELLAVIHIPLTISVDGKETEYPDGASALASLTEKYSVTGIDGKEIRISLEKQRELSVQETLAQAYAAVMGEEDGGRG